jgi:ribosome maturation factor RimP
MTIKQFYQWLDDEFERILKTQREALNFNNHEIAMNCSHKLHLLTEIKAQIGSIDWEPIILAAMDFATFRINYPNVQNAREFIQSSSITINYE